MIIPRYYQNDAIAALYEYFSKNFGNPVIAMPTGTGKSLVIAMFLHSIFQRVNDNRVVIATHVQELIEQDYAKLLELWPFAPAGVYSAGLNRADLHAPITFVGIQSVAKRWAQFGKVDLVIIDEADLVGPNDLTLYRQFLSGLKSINPLLKVIGLTATPWRLGHGKITEPYVNNKGDEIAPIFTDICYDITGVEAFNRLIAEGYLCGLIPKATKSRIDTDGLHLRGGEFIPGELQKAVTKDDITERAVRESLEIAHNRQCWLAFASGIEHAELTADILNQLGIPAIAIHSKMGKGRKKALEDFKAGRYRCAVNNDVLTTGFDHPPIDYILGLRPTMSSRLWVQMLGRGTRPYDPSNPGNVDPTAFPLFKYNCLVGDFAGNTKRLGPINDPVIPRKKGHKPGPAPVKECPLCCCEVHASLRFCNGLNDDGTQCNYEFDFTTKLNQEASTEALIKGDMPITEVFKIDHITYSKHSKLGRPDSVRVSYYCKLKLFEEFLCFEHEGYPRKKSVHWWKCRSDEPVPEKVADALELIAKVKSPTHLRVWVNKKHPEILAMCFDGTAFGQSEPTEAPTVETKGTASAQTPMPVQHPAYSATIDVDAFHDFDDDIPF